MLAVLANRTYGRLFAAQVIALVGTGLLTVALGLLAFDIAGANAGAVLGTALAIKMVAYVTVAPIVGAFSAQLPRRFFLIAMDLVRAAIALLLPFITEVWQVYLAVFVLQSASAAFTPTFQATIPDVLKDDADYTNALSLSRLAYDLESIVSPMIAAALLTVIGFHWLFAGTVAGFLVSAALVLSVILPVSPARKREGGIYDRTTRGIRIYFGNSQATWAPRTQHGRIDGRCVGHRQHGGARKGPAGSRRYRGRGGSGLLRCRLHALRSDAATASGADTRSHGHAYGRELHLGGPGCLRAHAVGEWLVLCPACVFPRPPRARHRMGARRDRVLCDADAFRAPAEALGERGGPASLVRRSVRAIPRLLARNLSDRRMAWRIAAACCARGHIRNGHRVSDRGRRDALATR